MFGSEALSLVQCQVEQGHQWLGLARMLVSDELSVERCWGVQVYALLYSW